MQSAVDKPCPDNAPTCMGLLLLYGGFIDAGTFKQLLSTPREQPLGDFLEHRSEISAREKNAVLHLQQHLRHLPINFKANGCLPDSLQLSLGQLLLENGEITREQLNKALEEHHESHQRLGEVLVKQQALSPAKLCDWLQLQKKLVTAAATAMLMLGCCSNATADGKRNFWEQLRSLKKSSTSAAAHRTSWGDAQQINLSGLKTVQRAFGELARSRDGSTVVSVSRNGLEISKRF